MGRVNWLKKAQNIQINQILERVNGTSDIGLILSELSIFDPNQVCNQLGVIWQNSVSQNDFENQNKLQELSNIICANQTQNPPEENNQDLDIGNIGTENEQM